LALHEDAPVIAFGDGQLGLYIMMAGQRAWKPLPHFVTRSSFRARLERTHGVTAQRRVAQPAGVVR
jgi:hypothetical protein